MRSHYLHNPLLRQSTELPKYLQLIGVYTENSVLNQLTLLHLLEKACTYY